MAAAPRRRSASTSSMFGVDAITIHPMVQLHPHSVWMEDVSFSGTKYSLGDLIDQPTDGDVEDLTKEWIISLLHSSINVTVTSKTHLTLLKQFQSFCATSDVRPDVTVLLRRNSLPVLTVEVLSGTYMKTLNKALINGVELLRMLRAHDETVSNTVSFVFPSKTKTYVTKVTVDFDSNDLVFKYSFETLEKDDVKQAVQAAIQEKNSYFQSATADMWPYYVRLSRNELHMFASDAIQVKSMSSLIIRQPSTPMRYWKYNPSPTNHAREFFGRMQVELRHTHKILHSLYPHAMENKGHLRFWLFKHLRRPLSRDEAKHCLIDLIEQIKTALLELHHYSGIPIAHMDLRLPNVCFTDDFSATLIDLDRCEPADQRQHARYSYCKSDMYTGGPEWENSKLDWKALGLMICYILDEHVQPDQYHTMISEKLVREGLVSERFVKNLVDNGKLLYVTRFAKRYHIPRF